MGGTLPVRGWAGLWLALFALAVRMAVPLGFMPAGDRVALVACPEAGPVMHAMPGMAHHGHDGDTHAEHRCPFAGVSAAAALAGTPPLLAAVAIVAAATPALRPLHVAPGLGLAAPPPPKTGPPLLR